MKSERGQAVFFTVLFLLVLMGCTALTLDVGNWYRAQRAAQSTADAAALAGAEALPGNPTSAVDLAHQYAVSNGGGAAAAGDVTVSNDSSTVSVRVTRPAQSFFASVLSIGNVTVRAHAAARTGIPQDVWGAAPIVVNKLHPMLAGAGCPCFHQETTLPLGKVGAPGAFGIADLDNTGGNTGNSTLADWVTNGFEGYLPLGLYDSDPGAKFNGALLAAIQGRVGSELLFPVYDTLGGGGGSNAQYNVIGWVAFHIDCVGLVTSDTDCVNHHGNNDSLTGYFTSVIWKGIQSQNGSGNQPDYGVYSIALVN